jgi:putative nucleotidyltransferase with HDIG domain
MDSFSFKKIKFFRGEDSCAKKVKNNHQSSPEKAVSGGWERLIRYPYFFLLIFGLLIALLVTYVPSKSLPEWEKSTIAPSDLVAPEELTIEDVETTENRKREAEALVLPVYDLNPNSFLNMRTKIREFFESGRELISGPLNNEKRNVFIQTSNDTYLIDLASATLRTLIKLEFSSTLEASLIDLMGKTMERGIILDKNLFTHNEKDTGFTLVRGAGLESQEFVSTIWDREEAKNRLIDEVNRWELQQDEKSVLVSLSHGFLTANINFNADNTDLRKLTARLSIDPIYYTVKKGKVIIRKGDEVSDDVLRQIQDINQNLSSKPKWLVNFAGSFILFTLFLFGILYYLRTRKDSDRALNRFVMLAVLLVLSLLIYKMSGYITDLISQSTSMSLFSIPESYQYAFPIQIGVLLVAYLVGVHLALFYGIINSILFGYMLNSEFLIIYALLGGFAAILGVKILGKPTRTPVLQAGMFIALFNAAAVFSFHLLEGGIGPILTFMTELGMGVLGGFISSALAFLFIPIFENLFRIVTPARLVELTNSELPIFRKMALQAPGSYHHSLVVASLAEAAAEEIELDPMLVKAGALYHDVGKIIRPEYFIENRTRNLDMHQDLKPSMSTLVIINHVKEGVEQAKKMRLPKKIQDMIAQHHGNSLVRYFFEKAKEEYDPEMQKIGEESYRYPGPRPKSKEAALVMIADSVEAASRSLNHPTKANLKRLITEVINASLQDGQLDDSYFSLGELKHVANSFLSTLDTIYHPRVEYPGFDFENKKARAANINKNHDRNSKPAKTV